MAVMNEVAEFERAKEDLGFLGDTLVVHSVDQYVTACKAAGRSFAEAVHELRAAWIDDEEMKETEN